MDGAGSSACPGPTGRYLSGLCVAGLGLCAAGWLVLTPFAFGYQGRGWHAAMLTDLATGGGLAVICVTTLIAWTLAWRRALRADGVLTRPERVPARARRGRKRAGDGQGAGDGHGQARAADPEQVLTALRALLTPMLDAPAEEVSAVAPVIPGPRSAPEVGRVPRDCQVRSAESMLAGAELLMTGRDEEEAW
jgi:hypothetical protein